MALLFAAIAVAAVGLIVGHRPDRNAPATPVSVTADAGAALDAGQKAPTDDAGTANPTEDPSPDLNLASDAGATLIDGAPAPALAGDAPKSVVFGVILIQYKGAQGALPTARSHEAALELAKQLAADAKTDFKAALAKGDKGSLENAGRMPRGMLEPAPEYVLFTLPKDGVSDPVDTPRGFWVVHRIE